MTFFLFENYMWLAGISETTKALCKPTKTHVTHIFMCETFLENL